MSEDDEECPPVNAKSSSSINSTDDRTQYRVRRRSAMTGFSCVCGGPLPASRLGSALGTEDGPGSDMVADFAGRFVITEAWFFVPFQVLLE